MILEGKIWGHTSPIFSANNVEIHRIEGKKGGISSIHKHQSKQSMLFVESGIIKIAIIKNDYHLTDETILKAGQSTIISIEEWHNFEIIEDAICYEIYWVTLDPHDIIRKNCGSYKPEP